MNKSKGSESGHSQVILAAGGIVKRVAENGIEILLIRRKRYGTEWCLPKGKINNNESIREAAIREIHEETGCTVELLQFLDADIYSTKDSVKCVFYWLCQVTDDGNFVESEEVKEIAWMTPQQAIYKLTYKGQRDLVRKTVDGVNRLERIKQRVSYWYSRYIDKKRWKRLDSSIASYINELDCRYDRNPNYEPCQNALDDAIAALNKGDIDKGWKCFHSAQRIELLMLNKKDDKDILLAKAKQIRIESEKLNSWRKAAIISLLSEDIEDKKHLPEILFDATLIRDQHYDNQAYKDELRRGYDTSLVILMTLILAWLYIAHQYDFLSLSLDKIAKCSPTIFVGVITFGIFGALFSAILKSADNSNNSSRIPEMTLSIHITLLRVALGAASAVIIYVILKSELVSIMLSDKITEIVENMTVATAYVIAFVSGTSERLVLKAIENINKS